MNMDNNYKMMTINKTNNDVQLNVKLSIYENLKITITTSIMRLDRNNKNIYIYMPRSIRKITTTIINE